MITLAMLLCLLVVSLLATVFILWASARIVRAGKPSFKRALVCGVVLSVVGIAGQLAAAAIPAVTLANQLFLGVIQLAIALLSAISRPTRATAATGAQCRAGIWSAWRR
ncbi:MAG: hypothetical protein L0Y71_09470 [Gemmataceae bacterium]|nr:hypothetical protein [Gemmataceae bacterium]